MTLYDRFEFGEFAVTIECDGESTWAYLIKGVDFVGAVWLVNNLKAPMTPPWTTGNKPPFLCPEGYAIDLSPVVEFKDDDFRVLTKSEPRHTFGVYYQNKLLAMLWEDAFPGKNRNVTQDSPIALAW